MDETLKRNLNSGADRSQIIPFFMQKLKFTDRTFDADALCFNCCEPSLVSQKMEVLHQVETSQLQNFSGEPVAFTVSFFQEVSFFKKTQDTKIIGIKFIFVIKRIAYEQRNMYQDARLTRDIFCLPE